MPRDNDRVNLELYQTDESDKAYELSKDGFDRHWIPKSLAEPTGALRGCKVGRFNAYRGEFEIEKWKAEECGFLVDDVKPDGQGSLF